MDTVDRYRDLGIGERAMEYCLASAEKIPFSDESFDVVFGDFSTEEPLLRDHHIPGSARRAIRCGRQQNGHNQP